METLIEQPDASMWEASEDRAEVIYRIWGMNVLTGRRSSGRAVKRRYGEWLNMAELFWRRKMPRG
jgi:hypothetical protein